MGSPVLPSVSELDKKKYSGELFRPRFIINYVTGIWWHRLLNVFTYLDQKIPSEILFSSSPAFRHGQHFATQSLGNWPTTLLLRSVVGCGIIIHKLITRQSSTMDLKLLKPPSHGAEFCWFQHHHHHQHRHPHAYLKSWWNYYWNHFYPRCHHCQDGFKPIKYSIMYSMILGVSFHWASP